MTYLNAAGVLNNVLSLVQDNSAALRAKMLIWLNKISQELAIAREWKCLEKTATITIVSNQVLLPSDYQSFTYLKSVEDSNEYFLTERHRLTEEEAYNLTDSNATSPIPLGFLEDATHLTLYPGASGSPELKYVQELTDYSDDATDMAWPKQFGNAIERKILNLYYEYDMDERAQLSFALDKKDLATLKAWDNRHRPVPARTNYIKDHDQ